MDVILVKLLSAITDPVNIVLLLWIWWFIRDRGDLIEINAKLLTAQQDRGVTLSKIMSTVENLQQVIGELRRAAK